MRTCIWIGSILWVSALVAQPPATNNTQTASLEGVVVNAITGEPVPGARVYLRTEERAPVSADAAGRFRIDNLNPRRGTLISAAKPGFMMAGETPGSSSAGIVVQLPVSGGPASARIELIPAAALSGSITDSHGLPVPGATVRVWRLRPLSEMRPGASPQSTRTTPDGGFWLYPSGSATSNDLGGYRLPYLQAGSYYISASPSYELRDFDKTVRDAYYPASPDLAGAKAVELAAGQDLTRDLQFPAMAGVTVRGRIHGAPRENLNSAAGSPRMVITRIALSPSGDDGRRDIPSTESHGDQFELTNVLPGAYTLEALTDDIGDPRTASELPRRRPILWARMQIEVGSGGLDGVEVDLRPTRDIQGSVEFEPGCFPAPLTVTASGSSRLEASRPVQPDAQGQFRFDRLAPGNYRIGVTPGGSRDVYVVRSIRQDGKDIAKSGMDVSQDASAPLEITMGCRQLRRPPR